MKTMLLATTLALAGLCANAPAHAREAIEQTRHEDRQNDRATERRDDRAAERNDNRSASARDEGPRRDANDDRHNGGGGHEGAGHP